MITTPKDSVRVTGELRKSVLAENVKTEPSSYEGQIEVTFDFLCPNCGSRHWAKEIARRLFSTFGGTLRCGQVVVRMPWAKTPVRDLKSIYGQ
jgi:predicted RNA-binding Zn-ribbon protein involved in translation (DUF1610 family)